VTEPLGAALEDVLTLLARRLVQQELRRAERQWRWLTPEQAGELLGISAAAVRQRVLRGQLRARRLEGRLYLDIHDLDDAVANGRYDARPPDIDKWAERRWSAPGPDDQGGKP
jgi:Helix-turn-helix domain